MSPFILLITVALAFVAYLIWRFKQIQREVEHLLKVNASLEQEKVRLTQQRNNQRERKRNENNTNGANRAELLERLQQSKDLRD
ncbi:DUF2681 domain-containing protein [[Haemophilus] felis]|uniref:DUF2681 domain-containing protein n=1 Tax=[Haemophilus] felis TaxID=123822 RepID=A0A1T0BAS4_9PAST|nr:DUF2681 domain-containing protein [[Haemophilus] felis]NBI40377.1 DUF2681 domain-containing protein [[Haemophilus] felis]OOS07106.1 hypothetical protein B0188_01610 [[Haemophilus] felis]